VPATWVSAHISEETKVRLDRFVRRTGQDRARTERDPSVLSAWRLAGLRRLG
jgi:hypothetical protein